MKRTTIFADEDLLLGLKDLAKHRGTTVSEIVRDALEQYLAQNRPWRGLPSFAGMGDSGRSDISERAEEILAEDIDRQSGWSVRDSSR